MAEQKSIPIIICGRTEAIGKPIVESLKPDYEVIAFPRTPTAAVEAIPAAVLSRPPPESVLPDIIITLGTGRRDPDYAPRAAVFGGAFGSDDIAAVDAELVKRGVRERIVLMRVDKDVEMPPVGPEYAKVMQGRVRKGLGEAVGNADAEGRKVGECLLY